MVRLTRVLTGLLMIPLLSAIPLFAEEAEWTPLFNGKNLDGWVNVNCAPDTFTVQDGIIVCTGHPHGVMRTDRMYENFELELEWMHVVPEGNSGLFVWSDPIPHVGRPFTRSIEIQILDGRNTENYTSHGDVFAIQGATCVPDRPHPTGAMRSLPSERRSNPAGEWNHYKAVCYNGIIKLAVNGKVVSGVREAWPRKGYICLESEGSETHFRNIRIREFPSTDPAPEEIADEAEGFRTLYTGVDLSGWKATEEHEKHWQVHGWRLRYDGKCEADDPNLWTEEEFGDFEMICDWRWTGKPEDMDRVLILPNGDVAKNPDGSHLLETVPDAGDSGIYVRGTSKAQINMWCWPIGSGEVYGYRTDQEMPPEVRAGVTPRINADKPIGQWNRFHITMQGDRLTVVLNGETVIEHAQLPGVPERGPIALQHHGDPIEFANIFIKELD